MSWQWIPAQIDAIPTYSSSENSGNALKQYKPGYYVGKGNDNGYILATFDLISRWYGDQTNLSSANGWIITDNPNIGFSCSAYTSADTMLNEWIMAIQYNGSTLNRLYEDSVQRIYYGKLVFSGDSRWLHFSKSQNRYIIRKPGYNENAISEPIYSTDTLSGGLSGDYFWSGIQDLDFSSGYNGPINFTLDGAVEQYKNDNPDYIDHILVEPYLNYYTYSSPAELTAYDEVPAGEYTNPRTGETKTVGIKTYKGDDNSIWKGFRINSTSTWNPPYYESVEHGRITYTKNTADWGDAWVTPGGNKAPKYVYANALSALPDNFTLKYYEYDNELSAYSEVVSAAIEMSKGPYQMLSSSSTILMGDYAQWR